MTPHDEKPDLDALNATANQIALTACATMMDNGFPFEGAAAIASAVLPTVRHVLLGELPANCAVIVTLSPQAAVKVYPSEPEARAASLGMTSNNVRHIGFAIDEIMRRAEALKDIAHRERAISLN